MIPGLESGADDRLRKPFGIRDMLARVAAILRWNERTEALPAGGGDKFVDIG